MLKVQGITKIYAGQTALNPIAMTFPAGRTIALIGPSGCGKSTLIRILIGLITPDRGQV